MSKELVSGEYCYVGDPADKQKRIWLGHFNGLNLCINSAYEDEFKNGDYFEAYSYDTCTPIEDEPEYYYIWERVENGVIRTSPYITDNHAKVNKFKENGWVRNDSTKRLPLGVSK